MRNIISPERLKQKYCEINCRCSLFSFLVITATRYIHTLTVFEWEPVQADVARCSPTFVLTSPITIRSNMNVSSPGRSNKTKAQIRCLVQNVLFTEP